MKRVIEYKLENLIKILSEPPPVWQNLGELQREGLIATAREALKVIEELKKDGD